MSCFLADLCSRYVLIASLRLALGVRGMHTKCFRMRNVQKVGVYLNKSAHILDLCMKVVLSECMSC
jgi:hypothetical protein